MRKVITGLVLGLATLTIVSATSPAKTTEAKTKYYTVKEAGKKMYNIEKVCYEKKIKKTVTLRFKCKGKKDGWDYASEASDYTKKLQLGGASALGGQQCASGYGYYDSNCKSVTHHNKKTKVATCKITINGKNKDFRSQYKNNDAAKKLAEEIQSLTKGKNQFEKAWMTMVWLRQRVGYNNGKNADGSYYALYKRKAGTNCEGMANHYADFAYLAGVKTVGTVTSDKDNHMWNWIKVSGKRYYIDATGETRGRYDDIVEYVKNCCDPYYEERLNNEMGCSWDDLNSLNKWYKETVDASAENFTTCKAVWNAMNAEQRKAFSSWYLNGRYFPDFEYYLTCDSFVQSRFFPADVFSEERDIKAKPSKWKHDVIKNGSSTLCK